MSKKPIRDLVDNNLDELPFNGSVIGGANYFTVALVKGLVPVDGLRFGYHIQGQNIEDVRDGEIHTFRILASNEAVARFIARYTAAPSNFKFLSNTPEVTNVEIPQKRFTKSSYEITVKVPEQDD